MRTLFTALTALPVLLLFQNCGAPMAMKAVAASKVAVATPTPRPSPTPSPKVLDKFKLSDILYVELEARVKTFIAGDAVSTVRTTLDHTKQTFTSAVKASAVGYDVACTANGSNAAFKDLTSNLLAMKFTTTEGDNGLPDIGSFELRFKLKDNSLHKFTLSTKTTSVDVEGQLNISAFDLIGQLEDLRLDASCD